MGSAWNASAEPIRCQECGCRIMFKKRQKRSASSLALAEAEAETCPVLSDSVFLSTLFPSRSGAVRGEVMSPSRSSRRDPSSITTRCDSGPYSHAVRAPRKPSQVPPGVAPCFPWPSSQDPPLKICIMRQYQSCCDHDLLQSVFSSTCSVLAPACIAPARLPFCRIRGPTWVASARTGPHPSR